MTTQNDKEKLKTIFLELLKEDKEFRRAVAKEVNVVKQSLQEEEKKREDELRVKINKHFDEFDDVYKALAQTD